MRFQTERCLNPACGTLQRDNIKSRHWVIGPRGEIDGTGYWVCSDECVEKVCLEFIEREYRNDYYLDNIYPPYRKCFEKWEKRADAGDISYTQAKEEASKEAEQLLNAYQTEKTKRYSEAFPRLIKRAHEEWDYELKKRAEKELELEAKRQEKEQREWDKLDAQRKKEEEKLQEQVSVVRDFETLSGAN